MRIKYKLKMPPMPPIGILLRGLVGPTGGSDSGEGREPLLPSAVGPRGRKRLAYMPRVSKAGCHPFIIFDY